LSHFDYFDKVYCIHLPNRERRQHIDREFERVGIKDVTYIHADPPPKDFTVPNMRRNPRAEFGAGLSHIAAIGQAMADHAWRPLFVEDDVVFSGDMPHLDRIFDVLYLGGHPREPARMAGERLAKVGKFSCAEAYSIRGRLLPKLLLHWCNRITRPDAMWDLILGEFAAKHDAYCIYPIVTEQAQFVSHIKGEIDDKRELVERGWRNNLSIR
jgi:hypothetical protein